MAGSVLILTAILGSAAATKLRYGRDAEWKPSAPTSTLDATGPDRWTHLRVSPRPTEGPNLDLRDVPLLRRDHIGIETCGFYPEDGSPMYCPPGNTCANIGTLRDCCVGADCTTSSFSSVCLNYDDPGCSAHNPGTTCCDAEANRPYCATYVWSTTATPNRLFTLFNCEDKIYSGQAILDAEPRTRIGTSSSVLTSSAPVTTAPPVTAAAASGNSTPVGAIVGGVIGGLAVIGLVVLGIFYMFFRNRRAANRGSYVPAAKTEPEGSNGYESPSTTSPTAGTSPAAHSFNNMAPHSPPAPSASLPVPSVSPLSGSTATPAPCPAPSPAAGLVKALAVEAATSPSSKEMPTSPSCKEMPTSPAPKEMGVSPIAVELPSTQSRRAELPG